jgi:alanine dehydrogenase
MKVGVPREVKDHEYRVAITPSGVRELTLRGHQVYVEQHAGEGSLISDADLKLAGAEILERASDVWATADLLLKVKEPLETEYPLLREGQVLFTYLHLAASKPCTDALLASRTTAVAYETVGSPDGTFPLLAPMSEVAGRLAPQVGAYHMMRALGGRGILPGGVPGTRPAQVVIIGAGVAGMNAALVAQGMGAEVTLLDLSLERLRDASWILEGRVKTMASSSYELERQACNADLLIGAVLVPGARAPKLVTNELVSQMRTGSVLVDISIDQGGCFEDSRPTSHSDPTFNVHGSVFYCVANMPGAVPETSTYALTSATLPRVLALADSGWREAMREDPFLAAGLNAHDGRLYNAPVAQAHGLPCSPVTGLLG